jgi:hypothetical protein
MLMMAYAHDATKHSVASLESELEASTQHLQVKTLELKVAKSAELHLKVRLFPPRGPIGVADLISMPVSY